MQCWDQLEANEQKNGGFNIVQGGGPYVNIPMQSVPTILTMIVV